MTVPADDSSMLTKFVELVTSAVGGALVVLVAFRTRLALIDSRIEIEEKARIEAAKEAKRRFDLIDRRQIVTLELLADVARALNIENRYGDTLMKFLSKERDDS